jgi:general secretion pathway protein G
VRTASLGFTMMELLVVLAILGLLAGLAVNQVTKTLEMARIDTARIYVRDSIKIPLFTYQMSVHEYPSTADGLNALLTAPSGKGAAWRGPYIETGKLLDPWNEPYQYAYPAVKSKSPYDVWSKGPDKISGTEDDIGNWDPPPADGPK